MSHKDGPLGIFGFIGTPAARWTKLLWGIFGQHVDIANETLFLFPVVRPSNFQSYYMKGQGGPSSPASCIFMTQSWRSWFFFKISNIPDYVFFPAIMTIWSPRLNHCVTQFIFDLQICYRTVSFAQKNILSAKSIVLLKLLLTEGCPKNVHMLTTGSTLFHTIKIDVCSPFTALATVRPSNIMFPPIHQTVIMNWA